MLFSFTVATPSQADSTATLDSPLSLSVDGTHLCSIGNYLRPYCSDWDSAQQNRFQTTYASQIATNSSNTCILTLEGKVSCLGVFSHQDNTPGDQIVIPAVLPKISKISASESNLCLISNTNDLACIGRLGTEALAVPSNLGKVQDVYTKSNFVCVTSLTKDLKCFGNVYSPGSGALTPITVPSNLGKVSVFSATNLGFCVVNTSGDLKCLGAIARRYLNGNLSTWGYDDLNPSPNPGKVSSVSLDQYGGKNGCVITVAKTLTCWGYQRPLVAPAIDVPLDAAGMGLASLKNVVEVETSWRMLCVVLAQGKSFSSQCFGNFSTIEPVGSPAAPTDLLSAVQLPSSPKMPKLQVSPILLCLDSNCYGYSSEARYRPYRFGQFKTFTFTPSTLTVVGAKKSILLNFTNIKASYCRLLIDAKVVSQHFDATEKTSAEMTQGYNWVENMTSKPGKHKVEVNCQMSQPYLSSLLPKVTTFSVTVTK
jgi:hypothetical protein